MLSALYCLSLVASYIAYDSACHIAIILFTVLTRLLEAPSCLPVWEQKLARAHACEHALTQAHKRALMHAHTHTCTRTCARAHVRQTQNAESLGKQTGFHREIGREQIDAR